MRRLWKVNLSSLMCTSIILILLSCNGKGEHIKFNNECLLQRYHHNSSIYSLNCTIHAILTRVQTSANNHDLDYQ